MKSGAQLLCFLSSACLVAGCGDDKPDIPAVETCANVWQKVFPVDQVDSLAPRALGWHDGAVYYAGKDRNDGSVIQSVPTQGGSSSILVAWPAEQLRIEGDNVVFSDSTPSLWTAPVAGGEPTLSFEFDQRSYPAHSFGNVITESHFYWHWMPNPYTTKEESLWRVARNGGTAEKFSDLPTSTDSTLSEIAVTGASVILWYSGENTLAVPKEGGEARQLGGALIGTSDDEVLLSHLTVQDGASSVKLLYDVVRADATGNGQKPFWTNKPPTLWPGDAVSDGQGGWFVLATEPFTDGDTHLSVWAVDARGDGRRLACDSVGMRASTRYIHALLPSPDGLFASLAYESRRWNLVKIPVPPPAL